MIQLTPKQKAILRWVGYPLLALVVFVAAAFYTFPYERLKEKLIEVAAARYDLTISSIEPTLVPGGVVLKSVTLQDRPNDPTQVPSMMFFEEVEVDIGLFALLLGRLDVSVAAETASGSLDAAVSSDSLNVKKARRLEVEAKTENLQLAGLPGVREAVGLPVAGGLNASFRLVLPKMKFADAEGYLKFTCGGCTIGDGVSKIKPRLPDSKQNDPRYQRRLAMYGDGLTVPMLSLGATEAIVTIKDGVGKIEKLEAVSPDGQLSLEGEIRFADPFKDTRLPGCLRFRVTEELKKREKDFGNIDLILDAKRGDDGFFAFPTEGKLSNLRWNTRKSCEGVGEEDTPSVRKSRPRISTRSKTDDNGAPKTAADSEEVKRALGSKADEPEIKGQQPSGPTLLTRRDAGVGDARGRDEDSEARHDDVGDDDRDGDRGGSDERDDDAEEEDGDEANDRGDDQQDNNVD